MEDHGLPRGGRFKMSKLQGRNMLCHSNKLQSGWRTTLVSFAVAEIFVPVLDDAEFGGLKDWILWRISLFPRISFVIYKLAKIVHL